MTVKNLKFNIEPKQVGQFLKTWEEDVTEGKDAESIFKVRAELSDKEVEQWARESYMDKKGFIRQ
jgi:hypothetical protein